MPKAIPEGYYRDHHGEIHKDRRAIAQDRRNAQTEAVDADRRNRRRRASDIELREREADQQIEDALETFAEEHEK